jgi:serine acetyltransferase
MKKLLAILLVLCPWWLRRVFLRAIFGYKIHPTARIGLSLILVDRLELEAHAKIGSFSLFKGLSLLRVGESGYIGNLNWVTAYPQDGALFYTSEEERKPELIVERHAAISNRHLIDCSNSVLIGEFATFGGWRSQVLTHSQDIGQGKQVTRPVRIGAYSFVGTGIIIFGGSILPDHCILGAGSVLNQAFNEPYMLYSGNPARPITALSQSMEYFNREKGFVS